HAANERKHFLRTPLQRQQQLSATRELLRRKLLRRICVLVTTLRRVAEREARAGVDQSTRGGRRCAAAARQIVYRARPPALTAREERSVGLLRQTHFVQALNESSQRLGKASRRRRSREVSGSRWTRGGAAAMKRRGCVDEESKRSRSASASEPMALTARYG